MDAHWLNAKRIRGYSRLIVALYALAIVTMLMMSPGFIDPMGKPIGTDFLGFWSAGRMALDGRAAHAYDYDRHAEQEQKSLPWKEGQEAPFLPWLYPPQFLIAMAGFAMAPYGIALALWLAATIPLYLGPIRTILPGTAFVAMAFPAVLLNLAHGQTGFLTVGLLGGALLLLEKRPWISGVLIGLLAYKPQFGILIPLALIAGSYWRTICSAVLTIVATVAGSWAVLGGGPWRAFFASLHGMGGYGLEHGTGGLEKLQSMFAAVRILGGGIEVAWTAQALFALLAAGTVMWTWRKCPAMDLRSAALVTGIAMTTPYIFDYDLTLLALPIAWLGARGIREGFLPWEKMVLCSAWLLPILSRPMGKYLHLPLAPLAIALLLGAVLRRAAIRSEPLEPLQPSHPA